MAKRFQNNLKKYIKRIVFKRIIFNFIQQINLSSEYYYIINIFLDGYNNIINNYLLYYYLR